VPTQSVCFFRRRCLLWLTDMESHLPYRVLEDATPATEETQGETDALHRA